MKKIISIVLFSALGGIFTLGAYKLFVEEPTVIVEKKDGVRPTTVLTSMGFPGIPAEETDFTVAAEKTLNSVVHVKNTSVKSIRDPFTEFFYGEGSGTKKYSQVGIGSGVIISSDGYIVTNNHVINDATEIEVTLNNKQKYIAELVGADPTTDIALLKIEENDLPYIVFSNSDNLKVGEWVLAVGNPYNLTSTVTAGIVSAKGRDLAGNTNWDSFIQTDAAVNQGNSGGALVNVRGELVGINTAISSRTGSFIGYSFAVPSNIAKKVIEDLMEFGAVQEAILGIRIGTDPTVNGVKISSVEDDGGAKEAGLKAGDIIVKANGVDVKEFSDLSGQLKAKRPGDNIRITVLRDGSEYNKTVALKRNTIINIRALNIGVKDLSNEELKTYGIKGGAKIVTISNRDLLYYGVKNGYIITKVNKEQVRTANEANALIAKYKGDGPIYLEMMNEEGEIERFAFR
jgi:Do/DeqQ family serine protease